MIVFAKTRHHYDSYTDFWSLVELSGFPICFVDEIDVSKEVCYILTPINGEVLPHLKNELEKEKRATIVWWCLERFDAMPVPYPQVIDEAAEFVDQIWVSDRWISTLNPKLKYARFGSHPGLGADPGLPQYDFTHQSYAWGRRADMYGRLRRVGFSEGPSCWGAERHEVLRTSRLMLNLQQYHDPVTAPIRFAVAAAYHLPIVSESINDPDHLEGLVRCVPYNSIPQAVKDAIADPGEAASRIFQTLCEEWTFRRSVEATV